MEKALEFNHVSLIWPDFKIDDVTFSLEKGYIMGLVGYNGAGKTTLFRLMENRYRNYSGEILVDGYDCRTQEAKVKNITAFISDEQIFSLKKALRETRKYTALIIPSGTGTAFISIWICLKYPARQKSGIYPGEHF